MARCRSADRSCKRELLKQQACLTSEAHMLIAGDGRNAAEPYTLQEETPEPHRVRAALHDKGVVVTVCRRLHLHQQQWDGGLVTARPGVHGLQHRRPVVTWLSLLKRNLVRVG